jgi:hypothetical protein
MSNGQYGYQAHGPERAQREAAARAEAFMKFLQTPQYDTGQYGASLRRTFTDAEGRNYRWNPRTGMYEVVGTRPAAQTATTGTPTTPAAPGGGAAGSRGYPKIDAEAMRQINELRAEYMRNLGGAQDDLRQSKASQAEALEERRSLLAGMGMGGGLPLAGIERLSSAFTGQQAALGAQKAALRSSFEQGRFGVQSEAAKKRAAEARKRAAARAAQIQADVTSEVQKLSGGSK